MRTLKVLSIDWDYFVNATMKERVMLFPDGGNEELPPKLAALCWINHYMYPTPTNLADITVDEKALRKVKKLIKCGTVDDDEFFNIRTHLVVANSHKHLYQIIKNFKISTKAEAVKLVNIDFHHDLYNTEYQPGVNCGNWALHIFDKKYDTDFHIENRDASEYIWVAREDSDKEENTEDWLTTVYDINDITQEDWDIVFICRSDPWSPPHLDRKFKGFVNWCEKLIKYQPYRGELINDTDRYNKQFQNEVVSLKKQYDIIKQNWVQK